MGNSGASRAAGCELRAAGRESKTPFIVIEGIDGSGKTTQVDRLCRRIGGTYQAEPTHGPIGRLIRAHLQGREHFCHPATLAQLFALDRKEHCVGALHTLLHEGKAPRPPVVCDRYVLSSLAYQGMQLGDVPRVWRMNVEHGLLIRPHVVVFLHLAPDVANDRIKARGGPPELFEKKALLTELASWYGTGIDLLRQQGWHVRIVDADGTESQIGDRVLGSVNMVLLNQGFEPIVNR